MLVSTANYLGVFENLLKSNAAVARRGCRFCNDSRFAQAKAWAVRRSSAGGI
jgi:hypothetical protein